MKKTAFLVNTARGKIIKEKDLALALNRKIIAGAALDVFENEPIGKSNPLTKIQNVVLVPHIGSSSTETRKKMAGLTVKNLILDLLRRVTEGDRIIRKGDWNQIYGAHDYVGTDLAGKTIGILGLGRIGKAVALRGKPFGMKIIYHNRKRLPLKIEKSTHSKFVSLNELLRKSDVVSIHVPYSKQTHQLVDMNFMKKMKKTAFLVNTARGKIIKEKDLALALKRKIIAGAALDVFENEPIGKSHPLTKIQNCVLVPHIGSSSAETRKMMAELTVKNLILALSGKKLIYSV